MWAGENGLCRAAGARGEARAAIDEALAYAAAIGARRCM
jgi:hydroxypyruvate isomerase